MPQPHIRNFCIIAHIDHGKSTLADRLIEYTGTLSKREMDEQVLDSMDLERERGITIKLQAVRLEYRAQDGELYQLNLIDTPGHVDFSYEVSRSLAACEGAILVVDATQGIEAQTLANVYLALEHDLAIIPVINKIDLPSAEPERVMAEIEETIGLPSEEVILCSAKEGTGIPEILEAVVQRIPPPQGDPAAPLQALIFDSHYDNYRGVISYIRVMQGTLKPRMRMMFMASGKAHEVTEVGTFRPAMQPLTELKPGEVGYVTGTVRSVRDAMVGDTITDASRSAREPLPGYRQAVSMVFCGIYPSETNDYGKLGDALEKLHLNDAALNYEAETSAALGFGYRCGFLGLLHMEIVQERLERHFDMDIITTAPNVIYRVTTTDGRVIDLDNPAQVPKATEVVSMAEPYVKATIITPDTYIGTVMELVQERRGTYDHLDYLDPHRAMLIYIMPLAEIVYDFFDQLKSRTKGYASLDYEVIGYRESDLVKVDILLSGEAVDALTLIVHTDKAQSRGRAICEKLRKVIPRQQFEIPIQAAIGAKIIARETISAYRKEVLAKCYGGDVSRKRKLLERQKEGKKRMKQVGNVELPQEAFMAVLEIGK
ncbi:MAG: translation elongation factor 4 [Symbiobacteriaceae bacterium]|nr:translation elongation factor 4 [Symbiobacteriaceae bacterium]